MDKSKFLFAIFGSQAASQVQNNAVLDRLRWLFKMTDNRNRKTNLTESLHYTLHYCAVVLIMPALLKIFLMVSLKLEYTDTVLLVGY